MIKKIYIKIISGFTYLNFIKLKELTSINLFVTKMKIKLLFLLFVVFINSISYSQVGINTTSPDPSAALDVMSGNSFKGILIPRIPLNSTTDIITINNPQVSLLVYNTTSNDSIAPGYYYWNGSYWNRLNDSRERMFYGVNTPSFLSNYLPGDMYVQTTTGDLYLFNGNNWVLVGSKGPNHHTFSTTFFAQNDQLEFILPWSVDINSTKIFRNGININYSIEGDLKNVVTLENSAKCYSNDEIKIYNN